MEINRVTYAFFSPTGGTYNLGRLVADEFRMPVIELDITGNGPPQYRDFTENELLIAAVPCYGGRVPPQAAMRLANIAGRNTPAIPVVAFGNRDYGDALCELGDILTGNGFIPVAGVAAVCRHALDSQYGTGRPDEKDRAELKAFAMKARAKIGGLLFASKGRIQLEGDEPYCRSGYIPFTPSCGLECTLCLKCVDECPAGAIPRDNPHRTDGSKCLVCTRCIQVCPSHARHLNSRAKLMIKLALSKACAERKTNMIYL